MTFEEWWEAMEKEFGLYAIPNVDEIKWISKNAWNKAVNVMIEQEEKSVCQCCEDPDCRHFRTLAK